MIESSVIQLIHKQSFAASKHIELTGTFSNTVSLYSSFLKLSLELIS
jgi:hypothetical protein